jgi:hypothetical protein
MLCNTNLEAINLVSDVITILPLTNVDWIQIKNRRYLKSAAGKIVVLRDCSTFFNIKPYAAVLLGKIWSDCHKYNFYRK